jgi:DNA-binding transcriptional MerR regulator
MSETPMRYRVDELAARCGISVDTVRFYQTKGLLPPPERKSRVAWYTTEHLERLRKIRDLKRKSFTLNSIRRLLDGELDAADEASPLR